MKKLTLFISCFALAGALFTSCSDDTTKLAPVITFDDGDTLSLAIGVTTATLTGTVVAEAKMKSALFSKVTDLSENPIGSAITDFESGIFTSTDDINCTFRLDVDALTNGMKIKLAATDKDDQTSSKSIVVKIASPSGTNLSAETNAEWKRIGGAAGTGLSTFGLKWTSNTSTYAKIVKDAADKFVQLENAAWTDITTKEELATAVEAAAGITEYDGISVVANKSDYTDILATKYNSGYFMIKIVSSTVETGGAGTTITVSVKYKE